MAYMSPQDVVSALKSIIDRERADCCPMASEGLIEPALRRWRSYARRFKKHKDQSLEHRAHDLEKGLIASFGKECGYVPGCVRHLARSFAEVMMHWPAQPTPTASHRKEE
jgi:hypothetical protein